MDDELLLQTQRRLRRKLFEGPHAIAWPPARELAAQLLLYLDEPLRCWQITAEWLRDRLDADRVDGGYGGWVGANGAGNRYVVLAEARRTALPLPSVLGIGFDAGDRSIRAVWAGRGVAVIAEVEQERRLMSARMRRELRALGTAAKLALPLRDGARPIGLMCADWHRRAPRWNAQVCNELPAVSAQLIGPVLAAGARLERETIERDAEAPVGAALEDASRPALGALTPAELRVAQLVAQGLSYKEVARQLDRSLSTVDHQLRSIRTKLGARSTSRLVHLLSCE